ncbi:MAG: ATP-binding cassette domain-containing protein [Bacteroidetes bacterium]|nr:ATP-binding cassette domain-containing protein [Bacteroidota bacterium]
MNILVVEHLSKSFGERILFEDISFGLSHGSKVALVARNGAGKSTLLSILAGEDTADSGKISFNKSSTVGYLKQEPEFYEHDTIIDHIFKMQTPAMLAVKEYERLLSSAEHQNNEETQAALQQAMVNIEELKAWDLDARVRTILGKLGLHHIQNKIATLSGGQRRRIALAQLLIESPDVLLMDEPTNHLDVEMVEWLEGYLSAQQKTVLLITHDRYFLDRVCDEIIELDNNQLYHYRGNYEYFLEKKAEREFNLARETDKAKNLLRTELEWMRKQPKARTTKSKARIDAYYDLKEKASIKTDEQKLQLDMKMSRIGGKVLELKKVYKSFGEKIILNGFDYTFKKGERIGIIGSNGAGKSTFLNMITGKELADSGKVNVGETIVYGYYTQQGLKLNEDKRVIEVVKEIADVVELNDKSKIRAEQFLELFMFPPQMQYTYVSSLSGGEKRRLMLLTVLIKNPNFLILDEPTNDLDLLTLQTLEDYLQFFPGCLIIVSHDRYFMDKLVDHLLVFEGNGHVRDFPGNYSDYRNALDREEKEEKQIEKENKITVPKERPIQKLTFKEKFELEQLDKRIPELENEKKILEEKLTVTSVHNELIQLSERLGQISTELDEKSLRWLELQDKAERTG